MKGITRRDRFAIRLDEGWLVFLFVFVGRNRDAVALGTKHSSRRFNALTAPVTEA